MESRTDSKTILRDAKTLVRAEAQALESLANQLGDAFVEMVHLVAECRGKVFVSGSGTSGTIAQRVAHLLAACGTPAFFMHPAEALHGESALVQQSDVAIFLSKAGQSAELNRFALIAHNRGASVIAWTGAPESELASTADVVLFTPTDTRAEGEGILPFGSSLAHGAIGDALCLLVRRERGFDLSQFVETHPSGGAAKLVREGN
jgi:D-arabinose 5-phosphate isomerase GutQ